MQYDNRGRLFHQSRDAGQAAHLSHINAQMVQKALASDVETLDETVARLEKGLREQVGLLDQRLEQVEQGFRQIEERFDGLSKDVRIIRANVGVILQKIHSRSTP